ncbi:MAG: polyhydroxyalkanoate synthesis repressor PhaR [Pseudomonadota bacterium]
MSEIRVIKKYPNRRLYDTAISSYITLNDVKELVLTYTPFKVIEAKTGDDLTRGTLLQIISEQEDKGNPIFNTEILQHIIRFYGDSMQAMMSRFLEHSMKMFIEQQAGLRSPINSIMGGSNPVSIMQNVAEQNLSMWKTMQANFLAAATGQTPDSPSSSPTQEETPTATTPPSSSDDSDNGSDDREKAAK